ncbi:MAG: tetratricopeptide repeat protein [Syntrophobacteraceae bacterium]|nr:tetratricopeptide repeat protein [Syntrophobacteraceae bacterium]
MRRLSLLLVACIVALSSGCATGSQRSQYSADQLKSLGEKALMAHETATSLKFLTEALRQRPHDASIEYDLALAYNQRGFQGEAIRHIQRALTIKPDYPEALNAMGYMYAMTGQFDLAKAAFVKALNDPFYQTPQIAALNLGELYQKRGDSSQALAYYRQAVKLDAHYAQAWYRIGRILEQTGKNEQARIAYETAVRDSPELAQAHLRLGVMSYLAGDYKDAAGSFGLVERIAPLNSEVAGEARKYLEKINRPGPATNPSRYRSLRPKSEKIEPIKRTDIPFSSAGYGSSARLPVVVKGAISTERTGAPANAYANTPPEHTSPGGSDSPSSLIAPSNETAQLRGNPGGARNPGFQQYVVMVGVYPDRAGAEGIRSLLCAKGYNAVLRHEYGGSFAVLLQPPVDTFAEAAVLMSRLTGQTHSSPSIVIAPEK